MSLDFIDDNSDPCEYEDATNKGEADGNTSNSV